MTIKNFRKWVVLVAIGGLLTGHVMGAESEEAISKQVREILGQLTLEEKIKLTHGSFRSGGVPRLGISALRVSDGPVGIRLPSKKKSKNETGEVQRDPSRALGVPDRASALPATLLLAASWDRQSAYDYSSVIADEMLALNTHVLLAPGVNLMRDPRGGRSYEYFGEDPYLTAEMTIGYVRGLQDKKVGANLKHYVANDMDSLRHLTSSSVDEQTLREVYVYPFERAIREANAWSLMAANNLVNDRFVAEHDVVLKQILREQIGFTGVILTDWRAAYKANLSALASLDMTTGVCSYVYGKNLRGAVDSGEVPMKTLDEMVTRILKNAPSFFTEYKKKSLIGHAWFEVKGIKSVYAFGHGLSYTTFEIGNMAIKECDGGWTVMCSVKNTGKKSGADVIQLYVTGADASVGRKLRGFEKVALNPGETRQVTLQLRGNDLAYFDVGSKKWKAGAGGYTIEMTDRDCMGSQLKSEIRLERERVFNHP